MNERRGIQQLVFSAALAASPFLSQAATQGQAVQHGALRPAALEAPLRPVLGSDVTVTPVVYRPDEAGENSSVQAELQKIFRENNQQRQVVHPEIAVRQPEIELVQHTADEDNTRRTRRRDSSERKPGLFKRFFSKIAGNSEPLRPIGEPAPPIPQPPPIIFETKPSTKLAATNANKVTARPVGFRNSLGQSAAGQTATATQNSRNSELQGPAKRSTPQVARNSNFINPFADEARTSEGEALLDLDSLIQGEDSVKRPQRKIELAPPAVEHQIPKQLATSEPKSEKSDPTASPFTGYQLNTDEQLFETEDVAFEETESTGVVTVTAPKEAGVTTVTIANAEATAEFAPEPQNGAIPLLAEPKTNTDESPGLKDFTKVPLVEEPPIAAETIAPSPQEAPFSDDATASPPPAVDTPSVTNSEQLPLPQNSPSVMPSEAEKLQALSDRARQEQQIYRIMARSGETRFKGFCPVALRDHRELIDARPEFKAKFGLQAYHFSSPEAKTAFEANPSRYAPAAGGSDVVLLVNTGEEESGSLDFSLWYHDRLYMFRSRETQSIFSKDPLRYANQY